MCVIADKLVNQGREEGRELGRELGREEGKMLMIKKLITEGLLKKEDVLRVLGKTAEEFEKEFAGAN